MMKLNDLLSEQVIRIPLKSTEKTQIIEEMVDILHRARKLKDRDAVLRAVLEREQVMSTGIGGGVAIPHAKTEAVDDLVASFGITRQGVDFQSIDEKSVRIVFLLIAPADQTGPHLKALSRISRLMHWDEFRAKLIASRNSKEVIEAFAQEEQKYLTI